MLDKSNPYQFVYVSREPIFDAKGNTWAYNLSYGEETMGRDAETQRQLGEAINQAVAQCLRIDTDNGKAKLLVEMPYGMDLENVHPAFSPDRTYFKLDLSKEHQELFIFVTRAKSAGFGIAIEPDSSQLCSNVLLEQADIICLDAATANPGTFIATCKKCRLFSAELLAGGIEHGAALKGCRKLGFSYFHGPYFKLPASEEANTLSSQEASRIQIFRIIEQPEPDFEALTDAIETDVSISYRLLAFLNSAAFTFSTKVTSIKQAVVLVGWEKIKSWLRVVVLTDLSAGDKTRQLALSAVQRAKFLELAAEHCKRKGIADSLFLLGLFSLLDAMLDMPMGKIVEKLPLDEELSSTLKGHDTTYSIWLQLAQSVEDNSWQKVDKGLLALGLEPKEALSLYREAQAWANIFFGQ